MASGHLQAARSILIIMEGREVDAGDIDLLVAADGAPPSSLHRATIAGRLCGRDLLHSCIPLAGATVGYRVGADALPRIINETRTDLQGRFALPGIEPATYGFYKISVTAKGYDQISLTANGTYRARPTGSTTSISLVPRRGSRAATCYLQPSLEPYAS
jgi:hypothetical protein